MGRDPPPDRRKDQHGRAVRRRRSRRAGDRACKKRRHRRYHRGRTAGRIRHDESDEGKQSVGLIVSRARKRQQYCDMQQKKHRNAYHVSLSVLCYGTPSGNRTHN